MNILIRIGKALILFILIIIFQWFIIDPIINKIQEYDEKKKIKFDKELENKIKIEVNKQISKKKNKIN